MPTKTKTKEEPKLSKEYFIQLEYHEKKSGKKNLALFYQNGSFYQLYGIDNSKEKVGELVELKKILNLRFSGGEESKGVPVNDRFKPLMIGCPAHLLDVYIKKACFAGYDAVIYNQTINKKSGKIEREWFKTITLSTIEIDDSPDGEDFASNIVVVMMSVSQDVTSGEEVCEASLAVVNLSTGDIWCHQLVHPIDVLNSFLIKTLYSYHPKEIYLDCPTELEGCLQELEKGKGGDIKITKIRIDRKYHKITFQDEILKRTYTSSVSELGLALYPNLVTTLSFLLSKLYELDVVSIKSLNQPKIKSAGSWLAISKTEIDQIALVGAGGKKSVLDIIDKTSTPMGRRLLRYRLLNPINSTSLIQERYDNVTEMFSQGVNKDIIWKDCEDYLEGIGDIEKLHRKIFLGIITPFELYQLDGMYQNIVGLMDMMKDYTLKLSGKKISRPITKLKEIMEIYRYPLDLEECQKIYNMQDWNDMLIFKRGHDPELDEISDKLSKLKKKLVLHEESWAKAIDEKNGVFNIAHTPKEGYYMKCTPKRAVKLLKKIDKDGVRVSNSKTVSKIFTETITSTGANLKHYKEKLVEENKRKYLEVIDKLREHSSVLKWVCTYVSIVDLSKSCAKVSAIRKYVKPKIKLPEATPKNKKRSWINAKELRHPIIETFDGCNYVPHDVLIDGRGWIVFGANGSGKSVLLKGISIAVVLAHMGMYVPASKFVFYPFKTINIKMTLMDDIYTGESLFTKEMRYLSVMLENASPRSLILADELCNGTVVNDAMSVVSSSILDFVKNKSNFIITTHYHDITKIPEIKKIEDEIVYKHIQVDVVNGKLISNRILENGVLEASYGIEIAKQLFVGDANFIKTALKIRRRLNNKSLELVSDHKSKYNSKMSITECVECGCAVDLESHHILPQSSADEFGMIGTIHKNKSTNIKVLCKGCHRLDEKAVHKKKSKKEQI